jgi:hypothetical protein
MPGQLLDQPGLVGMVVTARQVVEVDIGELRQAGEGKDSEDREGTTSGVCSCRECGSGRVMRHGQWAEWDRVVTSGIEEFRLKM